MDRREEIVNLVTDCFIYRNNLNPHVAQHHAERLMHAFEEQAKICRLCGSSIQDDADALVGTIWG